MIKGTYAEQKIKDAIQKLKEASFCIEDIIKDAHDTFYLSEGERIALSEIKWNIIDSALELKDITEE